ncbi:MAG: uroporphyrinogen-III synthase [Chitinophagaceae bacterium]
MPQNKITILSTRPLPAYLVDEATAQGINVSVQSFIDTEPIRSVEVQQEIEQALLQSATIVFTSMNAVEAVAEQMDDEQPDWMIYCIGQTTQQLAKKYFGENSIAGTAEDAAALASLIVEEAYTDSVIFFCGDQRRDELPDILRNNDIEVDEIVVYHTIATPKVLKQQYNGILFFSPSAVHSFFSVNKPDKEITFFAIGNTTKASIKKYSNNTILVSDAPGKEKLLEKALHYFVNNEK